MNTVGLRLSAVLGVFAFVLYVGTLSAEYSSDGMAFARLARDGNLAAPLFFQAEHLLYPAVGWAFARLWEVFGFRDGPLVPLQVLNALAGGVSAGAFAYAGGALLPKWPAVLAALALAVSRGWWHHASDVEDQIIANAGLLVSFAAIAGSRALLARGAILTGRGFAVAGGLALAVLVHATTVLFIPAAVILLWPSASKSAFVALGGWLAAFVGLPYFVVGFGIQQRFSVEAWRGWLLAAPGQGVWGRLSPRNLWAGLQSFTESIAYQPADPILAGLRVAPVPTGAAFVLAAGALALIIAAVVLALRRPSAVRTGLLAWAIIILAFGTYWAPDDFQFWMLALPPLLLVVLPHVPVRATLAAVVVLFVWNATAWALPRHDAARNPGLAATRCLGERLTAADLLITPGWDWAGDYVPYFTNVPVMSLNDTFVLAAQNNRERFFTLVDSRMAQTRQNGGTVYLVRLDTLTPDEAAFFRRVTGLGAEDFTWRRAPAFDCAGIPVSEVRA